MESRAASDVTKGSDCSLGHSAKQRLLSALGPVPAPGVSHKDPAARRANWPCRARVQTMYEP